MRSGDAERHGMHSHAERGNDRKTLLLNTSQDQESINAIAAHLAFEVITVGASLLAKNVNDYAYSLDVRGALRFFASKLAPTVGF
ncbi:hypothetical protein AU074_20235 [Pseudomonas sp. ATCC PTA-122608]|nr:hypothetical protein AU074_20235 [Pseudomonas sp. ATCC PTA-122608]